MPYKDKNKLYLNLMERWKRIKVRAILYKGGKCEECGIEYDGTNACIFDFHHTNPETKEYVWTKLRLHSWDSITEELDKCLILCSNCHRQKHSANF